MIKIDERLFENKQDREESLREIKQYLQQELIVLIGEDGIPLNENQIREQLLNPDAEFNSKKINGLELEAISEATDYIERAEVGIKELLEEIDLVVIFKSFTDLMEALMYLEQLTRYFSFGIISIEKINAFGEKALVQMEKGNSSYLLDVIEYECLPLLLETKECLQQWKIN
jgi:hypothetical protein